VECFDPQVEQLDAEQLIRLGEEIVEKVESYDSELQVEVSVNRSVEEIRLLNTSGLQVEDRRTSFEISVEVTRAREGDILVVYDAASSRRREDVDGLALAGRIIQRLRWAEVIAESPSRAMPVVFTPRGTLVLLLPLTLGLNGRLVYMGTSPLGDRLGQVAFDQRLTLVDNGCLDFASRSAPYDDEGISTAEKHLIEEGVVRQFLYDLRTAAQAETQPTGNGFKFGGLFGGGGFRRPPGVTPATWLVPPGDRSLEEILGELDEALLVEQVIGLGQGNILAGEFSNNVSVGFLVRKGEIVGRVKNTMIAGNVYDLMGEKLIALSDRAEWVYGILRAPAVAVDGVSVIGRG
jgi:PmbA protein